MVALMLMAVAEALFAPTTKTQLSDAVLEFITGTGSYGGEDVSLWDVSGVEDMSRLFCGFTGWAVDVCDGNKANFNGDISGWDVGQVTNM